MCCAWIAARLVEAGYAAQNASTRAIIDRWRAAPAQACVESKSVDYLKRTRQLEDLDFILSQVNDLDTVLTLDDDEVLATRLP